MYESNFVFYKLCAGVLQKKMQILQVPALIITISFTDWKLYNFKKKMSSFTNIQK